ncbi:hypothetical protein HY491_04635 [Candidatus Woesearchaeota archaeon]|nr:hypothetical protein [Candidatus Woesearchaeota archaeon]
MVLHILSVIIASIAVVALLAWLLPGAKSPLTQAVPQRCPSTTDMVAEALFFLTDGHTKPIDPANCVRMERQLQGLPVD